MAGRPIPPPLPPRMSTGQIPLTSDIERGRTSLQAASTGIDNRERSTDSLRPSYSNSGHRKRKLLLIYIHGFMGDEKSFQSFPAHVHNVVTSMVSDSHVVHSKLYPRYRSKGSMTLARDDFSRWLTPHESDMTDTILLGHSMGGILSAEVALYPLESIGLKHRLIGTINFDVPFLGMHPGIIKTGLQSLFQSKDEKPASDAVKQMATLPEMTLPESKPVADAINDQDQPAFNPVYHNDVKLPVRTVTQSLVHFVSKHSDHLFQGTKNLVTAHMDFAAAMADYKSLNNRYVRLRPLEEGNDAVRKNAVGNRYVPPRVRFVNYYTASHGRAKREKSSPEDAETNALAAGGTEASLDKANELSVSETSDSKASLPSTSASSQSGGTSPGRGLSPTPSSRRTSEGAKTIKPPKDRKFCAMPPKDNRGHRDPTWVRVFMKDMDEVTAHCGLFFQDSPSYLHLVSEVAERVKDWIGEAESERVVKSMMDEDYD